jgi:nucleotide-binding universal stress UspA family protein
MYQHILLPTDGSELSQQAAREGVRFAKSIRARLTALHTTPFYYPPTLPAHTASAHAGRHYEVQAREYEEQSKQNATRALEPIELMAREAGVPCGVVHRVTDSPWQMIINVAAESGCDLIFMASHGRRGVSALLIGSETNKVLTHTKIPVLVWRAA